MTVSYPKISIVTPSYNQGPYIEQTIQSVIGQNYENLEYFIMDGGSTDDSVEIIKKHNTHITWWVSEKDDGQSSAINKAFGRAKGQIFAWLNSDDFYLPGTLEYVAGFFRSADDIPMALFGNCIHINELDGTSSGSNVEGKHEWFDIELCDYIIQPSCFWNLKAMDLVGPLNEHMNYAFDWEWFIRASRAKVKFIPTKRFLSVYRIHDAHKSRVGGQERLEEIADCYRRYHSPEIAEAYLFSKQGSTVNRFKKSMKKLPIDYNKWLYKMFFSKKVSRKEFNNFIHM